MARTEMGTRLGGVSEAIPKGRDAAAARRRDSGRIWGRLALFSLVLAALLLPLAAGATYQKIAVPYPDPSERSSLFFHPDLEYMGDDDGKLILLSNPELTAELVARGFEVEIVVPDLEAFYAERSGYTRDYGVWHTYVETVAEMNLLHTQFPNLTTAPSSIGTTQEGRTIWAMKISDNPNVQETEPEVYFDGMHHAREIMTVEVLLHYMRYLCENYESDPVIRFLVDNRQVWFIPLVNVDGFVYNETTNPNGGGMWRKNRRVNSGSSCRGVDPNRNYPYEWVGGGSSTDPCSETFRGPSAGSEPEIQAIINLVNTHNFVISQSYHSVAGMVLIPWGYTSAHTPDDAALRAIATEMARAGGYSVGQAPELLYSVNGGSCDWHYGATTEHPKIMAFSTEVGGSDFWPQPSERDGLIAECLYSNIYITQVAGAWLTVASSQVTGGDGNGRLDAGESVSLVLAVRNAGLSAATNVRASLDCQDPYIRLSDAETSLGSIAPGATSSTLIDPFELSVDASCPVGRAINFVVRLEADNGVRLEETLSLTVGQLPIVYADDFEQAAGAWMQDPTHTAATGAFVRADPVATPAFQPGDDTSPAPGVNAWFTAQNPNGVEGADDVDEGIAATRSPVIDLSGVPHARLDLNYFHGQRDTGDDPSGDYFRIDLSNNGGASFPVNLVLIGDVNSPSAWRNLRVNLDEHLPLTANMMIRVQAADGTGSTGMADIIEAGLDDVYIYNRGEGNDSPSAPGLVSPVDGAANQAPNVALVVSNAVDPEGDPLTYGFRVYSDALLTQLVASVDGIPQGAGGSTAWNVNPPLTPATTYYWRAFASDATSRGLFMAAASFTVIEDPTGIAQGAVSAHTVLTAGPNPSREDVRIRYFTPAAASATLEIFDPAGRRVRSLDGVRWAAGWQEVQWDGCGENGAPVPAGVYWVRLVLPDESRAVRVVRVR